MITCLSLVVIAVIVAVCNLIKLYYHEKEQTLEIVRICAENADILEIVGRMESSEKSPHAFIQLNSFMEFAQQKDGRIAKSDTLNTSLASLLRYGLQLRKFKSNTNFVALDSIFRDELNRHGMYPSFVSIVPFGSEKPDKPSLWYTQYSITPNDNNVEYDIYVSPMPRVVLSRMWGIIIPFSLVIVLFSYISIYLHRVLCQMRSIEQMKDDFTHNMTHELKTPVAVAYSAADSMLRYYNQSDETRNKQFLNIILQKLKFLSGMIENILSMSMARYKTIRLNKESLNIKNIVKEVAGMIQLKTDKSLNLKIDIPDNLYVSADSLHFGNVLSNLIDNAVKYSRESVEIIIRADAHSISVEDNGIGIDKESLPYIFDKFYRANSGNRYEISGYGLGLFYVKQIVDLFGWRILVTSRKGKGTKFIIEFNSNEKR